MILYGMLDENGEYVFKETQIPKHTHSIEVPMWPPLECPPLPCPHPNATRTGDVFICDACGGIVKPISWEIQ